MTHIQNAIVERVSLDDSDRQILSAWLHLQYDGSGQGFGGYSLYLPSSFKNTGGPNYCGHFIWRCMQIAGVSAWQDIPGKTIRVKQDSPFGSIIAIGHIVKEDWFDPKAEFELLRNPPQKPVKEEHEFWPNSYNPNNTSQLA